MSSNIAAATSEGAPVRSKSAADPLKLSRLTRLGYGFGATANGVKNTAFSTYLMLFYNQVVGLPASIVASAIAAALVVDALADPLIGRWSDVTRSRWGRRHPFIYASAIPTAIFFLLAWFPPAGMTPSETGLWIFVTAVLTRVSISFCEIPSSAMATELSEDYAERTRLFSLRYWFGYAGAFGFGAFCLAFFFVSTPEYPRGQLNPASYTGFAILGSAIILIAVLTSGAATHARIPYLRQQDGEATRGGLGTHLREMFEAFRNKGFLAIFGFGVLKYTAIGLYSATALYFGTYLFKLHGPQLALLTFDSLVAATLAAPLAPYFSRKLGKRNSSMYFAFFGVCIGLIPQTLSLFGLFMKPGHPLLVPTLFFIGAFYGAMVAISLINTSSMLADVVEDSAVETGRHTAGTFFSAASFMQQCSSGLGVLLAGFILTWSGFPEKVDPAKVSDAMVNSLLAHYVPTVVVLWGLGSLFLLLYPIDKARHEANLERLRAREAEAKEAAVRDAPIGAPAR